MEAQGVPFTKGFTLLPRLGVRSAMPQTMVAATKLLMLASILQNRTSLEQLAMAIALYGLGLLPCKGKGSELPRLSVLKMICVCW